jgi:hypothetical protein
MLGAFLIFCFVVFLVCKFFKVAYRIGSYICFILGALFIVYFVFYFICMISGIDYTRF